MCVNVQVCHPRCQTTDKHFPQEKYKGTDISNGCDLSSIAYNQAERLSCWLTERSTKNCSLDVCVFIEKFYNFFKNPQTTLAAAEESLSNLIVEFSCFLLQIWYKGSDNLGDSDNKRSKSSGAKMKAESFVDATKNGAASYSALVPMNESINVRMLMIKRYSWFVIICFDIPSKVPLWNTHGDYNFSNGSNKCTSPVETKE